MIKKDILPEFCYRNEKLSFTMGVVHYFSGRYVDFDNRFDYNVCRNLILDLNRPKSERKIYLLNDREQRYFASYHFIIDRGGKIYLIVPTNFQAYHAGASSWEGRTDLNRWSLGFALLGDSQSNFTEKQYQSLAHLCHKYTLSPTKVVGHEDVSPGRKVDPGKNFDWNKFRRLLRARYSGTI